MSGDIMLDEISGVIIDPVVAPRSAVPCGVITLETARNPGMVAYRRQRTQRIAVEDEETGPGEPQRQASLLPAVVSPACWYPRKAGHQS
jgi:hypothetical protein